MIYLLYGADTYRSRQKLNELILEHRTEAGPDLDFHRLDAEENNPFAFKGVLETRSLFSRKKLVVIENIFLGAKVCDVLRTYAAQLKESTEVILFLWAGATDAVGQKLLEEMRSLVAKTQEFKLLGGAELRHWIQKEAKEKEVLLSQPDMVRFSAFGGDLWAIANELEKMAVSRTSNKSPGATDQEISSTIFHLGDSFFTSRKQALRHLLHLLATGHDDGNLFSYLVNHARTLLLVRSFLERKEQVPAHFGLHPYVVKKATLAVRAAPAPYFDRALRRFFEEDYKIKTGQSRPKESLMHMLIGG